MLNSVEELTAGDADTMATEVPVVENSSRNDPFIVSVTFKAVVLAIVLAQLGLTKD